MSPSFSHFNRIGIFEIITEYAFFFSFASFSCLCLSLGAVQAAYGRLGIFGREMAPWQFNGRERGTLNNVFSS